MEGTRKQRTRSSTKVNVDYLNVAPHDHIVEDNTLSAEEDEIVPLLDQHMDAGNLDAGNLDAGNMDAESREPAPNQSAQMIADLDNSEGSDEEDSDDLSDMHEIEWPCSTVMCIADAVDAKLVAYFKKYLDKPGNEERIFQPSMMTVPNEIEDDEEEYMSNGDQVVDTEYRKCSIAKDTNTMSKLFNMLDDAIDAAVDKFVDKYQFFNIVSTKEDYTLLKFDKDDFFAEHIECTGLNDDNEGASRRLCAYVLLESPDEGGEFEFLYQGCKVKPPPGSIIVFPACPLHPLKISGIQQGRLMFVTNYIL